MAKPAPVGEGTTRLVHIVTVPLSLWTPMWGQFSFMRARGFKVQAISSPGEYLDRVAERDGIPVHAVEMPRRITPLQDLVALFRIWRLLRRIRPQIVNAGTPKGGLLGMIAAFLARVPVRIYHLRGLPLETATGRRRVLLRWSEKVSCRLAHRVISVSHSLRATAIREGLVRPEKIVVPAAGSVNGIDTAGRFNPANLPTGTREVTRDRFSVPRDALVIGFVGRIVRDKGLVELEQAWRVVRAEFPNAHLLLVGWSEAQDPLPPEVERRLRADERVHFAGGVDDMPAAYAAIDLIAFPTYREGLPDVLLEANAMGLPVVASDIPGCREAIVDGVTGTIVPVHNADALAEGLRTYLCDPGLRHRHGTAGRERVMREFRHEVVWDSIYTHYRDLLTQRGLAPRIPPADGASRPA